MKLKIEIEVHDSVLELAMSFFDMSKRDAKKIIERAFAVGGSLKSNYLYLFQDNFSFGSMLATGEYALQDSKSKSRYMVINFITGEIQACDNRSKPIVD